MLKATNISKQFGKQILFEDITFALSKGEKVGLVGRNGSGKSTLFRMILGEMDPDAGEISTPKGYRVGSLPQHIYFTEKTLLEEACLALDHHEQYDSYKAEKILFGLGFSNDDMQKDPKIFSGGFQIRINLTKALVQNPNLLLLDEPTNYLDIVSQRWLKQYLSAYPGEIILITHDREFMDATTSHIMGLHRQKLKKLRGDTENYYTKIAEEEETYEKTRKNQEKEKQHLEKYISRFRSSARRASQAQSRIKQLAKYDDLTVLAKERDLEFSFNYAPCAGKIMMNVENLCFAYNQTHPLIEHLSFSIRSHDRIGIIGKNGKGKSTLLNLLSGELTALKGNITSHPNMQLGHFGQTNIHRLDEGLSVYEEISHTNSKLTIEQVRNICGTMMFPQDLALKKIQMLSGGERSRVLLGKILAQPTNLLLLDEPTNHLDQESIEGLMEGLQDFKGAVAIVTHSEMILNRLVNKLIVFHHEHVEFIDGNYEYFLNKVGWDDTAGSKKLVSHTEEQPDTRLNKKEVRKQKSLIIEQRSKILTPLKNKIDELEKEICHLEEKFQSANEALIKASAGQDVQGFVKLSKEIKEYQRHIDKHFKSLEIASDKYEKEKVKFESLLGDGPALV